MVLMVLSTYICVYVCMCEHIEQPNGRVHIFVLLHTAGNIEHMYENMYYVHVRLCRRTFVYSVVFGTRHETTESYVNSALSLLAITTNISTQQFLCINLYIRVFALIIKCIYTQLL